MNERKKIDILKFLWSFLFCILFFGLLQLIVLYPLYGRPEILHPLLPETLFYAWVEFTVTDMSAMLGYWGLLWAILSLLLLIVTLFQRRKWSEKWALALFCVLLMFAWLFLAIPPCANRERSKRINCVSNLKQIGLALQEYADNHNGFYPPDLQTLETDGILSDRNIFRCIVHRPDYTAFSDYCYFGDGRKADDAQFVIVQDMAGNHLAGHKNKLYSNGMVQERK